MCKMMVFVDVTGPHLSRQSLYLNNMVQTRQIKTIENEPTNNEPILIFWRDWTILFR